MLPVKSQKILLGKEKTLGLHLIHNGVNVLSPVLDVREVKGRFCHHASLFQGICKRQPYKVEKLFTRPRWVVCKFLLLQRGVGTPEGRVLAGLEEELLLRAHHEEPDLLLQPHRDLHPGGGLGEDGQRDHMTELVAASTGPRDILRVLSEAGQGHAGLG